LAIEELSANTRQRTNEGCTDTLLDGAAIKIWRHRVIQWFFDIVDHFDLPRDVVYVASDILNHYRNHDSIKNKTFISTSRYQEMAIASIFLAARLRKPSKIAMESLLLTMGKTCTVTTSRAMFVVKEVIKALDWTYPILAPSVFLKELFGMIEDLIPSRHRMKIALENTVYLTELAILGDLPSTSVVSKIALAALIQTMNPKTGPADCHLKEDQFHQMTEKLKDALNLDCSNKAIQSLCQQLEDIHAQSLDSISDQQPRATPIES